MCRATQRKENTCLVSENIAHRQFITFARLFRRANQCILTFLFSITRLFSSFRFYPTIGQTPHFLPHICAVFHLIPHPLFHILFLHSPTVIQKNSSVPVLDFLRTNEWPLHLKDVRVWTFPRLLQSMQKLFDKYLSWNKMLFLNFF